LEESIPLPALDDESSAQFRFHLSTFYVPTDGWYIDDVVLFGGGPACVTPLAPTAEFTSNSPVDLGEPVAFTNLTLGTPPIEYLWDFGDGTGTSTETNPEYTYLAPGTYNVTLQATNGEGTDFVTHPVQVLGAGDTIHVDLIKMRYRERNPGKYVIDATLRILDQDGQPVAGAEVDVQWTLPDSSTVDQQAATNTRGLARFRIRSTQEGTFEICVTDVFKAGYSYDPEQNGETCDTLIVP
jgi:PKD repeat protein